MAELTAIRSGIATPSISTSPSIEPQVHTDDEMPSFSVESSPEIPPQELKDVDSADQIAVTLPAPDILGMKVVDEISKKRD